MGDDVVALFMENNIRYHEVYWAALRSGMYLTAVNKYLTAEEAAYIVADSGAKALVTSAALEPVAEAMRDAVPACSFRLAVDGPVADFEAYEPALAATPAEAAPDERLGDFMNYSSGTTGRTKGLKRPLSDLALSALSPLDELVGTVYAVDRKTIYLSPAPLYHAAPITFTAAVHSHGGTNVIMERFDAAQALALIEHHRATHSQRVPTMFARMLKLPQAARNAHDLSSHRIVVHAAAPCPLEVKRQMIDWWGPILHEYYGGTERNGLTYCDSADWLSHPGTVDRAQLGTLHICDDAGRELPAGEPGLIYFERDEAPFEYHNDPENAAQSRHPSQPFWTKLGDVGYLDENGFLYLTDRESFMIISGGVNIYPQEIEDCLILHPEVGDVAVFGVPHAECGEAVKAVVEPAPGTAPSPELAEALIEHARSRLAAFKVPRSVDFEAALPRLENGKLYKRLLKDRNWGKRDSQIV